MSNGDLKPTARPDPPVLVVPEDVGTPVEANAVGEENHEPPDCAEAAVPDAPPGGASAADPFAAGFLAATAYHSNQMRVVNRNASLPLADACRGNVVAAGTAAEDLRALGHLQNAERGQGALTPVVSAAVAACARGHRRRHLLRTAADAVAAPAIAASGDHDCGSCCGCRLRLPVQWSPRMRAAPAVDDGEGRRRARRGLHQVVLLN